MTKKNLMMENNIRSEIHRLISTMIPFDNIEQQHIDFVLQWIESGAEIFRKEKPAIPDTHLVCYFVIISERMDEILLVDHKKAGLWLPAGGHVEPGENPKETVKREAKEELGIESEFLFEDPILLTVAQTVGDVAKHTDVSLWYLLKGDPDHPLNYDATEFNQIQWFPIDQIPFQNSDAHMQRFIQKMNQLKEKKFPNRIVLQNLGHPCERT